MARIFVILVLFYIFAVVLFTIVSMSLVVMRAKSLSFALKGILIFATFPVLILTKNGREKLKNITNTSSNE